MLQNRNFLKNYTIIKINNAAYNVDYFQYFINSNRIFIFFFIYRRINCQRY